MRFYQGLDRLPVLKAVCPTHFRLTHILLHLIELIFLNKASRGVACALLVFLGSLSSIKDVGLVEIVDTRFFLLLWCAEGS